MSGQWGISVYIYKHSLLYTLTVYYLIHSGASLQLNNDFISFFVIHKPMQSGITRTFYFKMFWGNEYFF